MHTHPFLALSMLLTLTAACSSSSSSVSTSADGGPDSGESPNDSGADSTTLSGDSGPGGDAGSDAAALQDSGGIDASFEASVAEAGTGAISGLAAETWTWVPFPNSTCRDGSSTGIGVSANAASDKVMIFMEGGYACFNSFTCALNPASFGQADFAQAAAAGTDGGASYSLNSGILDRTQAGNPVKDWNFVYIPYCSGDIHAGNNVTTISGADDGGIEHFAGYANVAAFLSRVVPTFPSASQVLLAGMSAGGFGAAADYVEVADAFGSVPVVLLDDSGPFMEDPYLATCLQNNLRSVWGLDSTVGSACGAGCQSPSTFFLDYGKSFISARPQVTFGLIEGTTDGVISDLFGFGASSCTSFVPLPGATFTAGLQDIRTQLAAQTNFGAFLYNSSQHTAIQDNSFYTISVPATSDAGTGDAGTSGAGGQSVFMNEWVAQLIAGSASNAGP